VIDIDRCANSSLLRDVHPIDKLGLALMTMLVVLVADTFYISSLVLIIMSLIIVTVSGVDFKYYCQIMMVPLAFLLLSCAAIAFNISLRPDQYNYSLAFGHIWIVVSNLSLYNALNLLLRSLAAVSCLYFLALTTPMVQIIFVLRKMKVPGVVIDLMVLTYNSVFVFWQTTRQIYIAQLSRCGYCGFTGEIRSLAWLCSNLILKCLKNSDECFNSLLSRGFTGELQVLEEDYRPRRKNLAGIIVFDSSLLILYLLGRF
jgi:cobalt/nickel transport system permease protein